MLVIRQAVDIVLHEEAETPSAKRRQDIFLIAINIAPAHEVADLDKLVALLKAES